MEALVTELDRESTAVLDLVQALVGVVSPNFRWISLELRGAQLHLQLVLEHESPEDREEISDAVSEYEALQSGPVPLSVQVIVTSAPIWDVPRLRRAVFGRRTS